MSMNRLMEPYFQTNHWQTHLQELILHDSDIHEEVAISTMVLLLFLWKWQLLKQVHQTGPTSHIYLHTSVALWPELIAREWPRLNFGLALLAPHSLLQTYVCLWASKYLRNEENANKYAWQEPPYFYRNNSVSRHWDIASCSFASTSNTVAQPQRSLCGNSLAPRAVHQWADDRRRFSGCGKACRGWLMVF